MPEWFIAYTLVCELNTGTFNANFARTRKIAVLNTRNRHFAVRAFASRLLYNMHSAFIYTRKM